MTNFENGQPVVDIYRDAKKTKIARKYGIKNLKGKKKIYEFEVSISQFHLTNSRWCIISVGCLNKLNN